MTIPLETWIGTPLAHALGRTLAHFVWEGAAIAALLAAILYVGGVRSSRTRYALAVAALLTMVASFGVTLVLCTPRQTAVVRVVQPPRGFASPALWAELSAPRELGAGAWIVPLWMAGVLICYARIFLAWLGALRLRRRGVCAAPEIWQARLNELAARLKLSRPVVLLESCLAEVPVVIGWFRPVILAPLGLLAGLSESQVEAILVHELAHIRRYDYALNLLQGFVEGLLFYHPAVWWISHVVRAEREHCCDDVVMTYCPDARAYAAALAMLERNRPVYGEAVLAATGGSLMKRIHRLLNGPKPANRTVAPALAVGLLLIAVAGSIQAVSASRLAAAPVPVTTPSAPGAMHVVAPVPAAAPASPVPAPAAVPQDKKESTGDGSTDLPKAYRNWLHEDVAYIITKKERDDFLALKTDADRDHFIEEFWLKRDPTPGTPENEYKEEHYRRIAFVNEHFGTGIPGWKTDRGRIYIIYGPPDELDPHPNGGYVRPAAEGGGTVDYPVELWRYRWIDGVGWNVILEFDDPDRNGELRMSKDPNR
jgi:GWxTD domain-containing protein